MKSFSVLLRRLLPLLVLLAAKAAGQNQLPVLGNVKAVVDTLQRQVTITYDVADPDDASVVVSVQLTGADGRVTALTDGQGDLGFLAVGKAKTITGRYTDPAWTRHGGTVRLVANDRQKASVADLLAAVDSNRIKRNTRLVYGVRDHETEAGRRHLAEVRRAVADQFKSGRLATATTPFKFQQYTGENVVGTKEGVGGPGKTYVIGAHLDAAKGSPGGDDNATGVAGLLEVMHALSAYEFKHRIVLVGFDCEEVGMMGSQFFVKTAAANQEPIAGMINFDMIGTCSDRPNTQMIPEGFDALFPEVAQMVAGDGYRGNFAVCTSSQTSEELHRAFRESAARHVPSLKIASLVTPEDGHLTPTLAASDHASFWRGGIPALHLGDGGETRNPRLNTPADNLDGINYSFTSQTVKATLAAIAELAQIQHAAVASVGVSFQPTATAASR